MSLQEKEKNIYYVIIYRSEIMLLMKYTVVLILKLNINIQ